MSDSVRPHRQQPIRLPCPWDSPGKNTGVGCHFLLQCKKVKVKLLSRVRLFGTPWTAAYQALPSMGFFQARVLEWGAIAFSLYFCSLSQICLILLPIFGLPLPFCCSTILIELAAFYHFLSVSSCILLSFMALKQIRCHSSVPNP